MASDLVFCAYESCAVRAAVSGVLARLPDDALIRRAAFGLAGVCAELLRDRFTRARGHRVVLLVGSGNNGADALLAGALLAQRGVVVDALLVGDGVYDRGVAELRAVGGRVITANGAHDRATELLAVADLVVDGIVGDRGTVGLRGVAADVVGLIPESAVVVAVDLPSGVDPDTGETGGVFVRADVTVTFGAFKPCLLLPPACYAAGELIFVDVGIAGSLAAEPVVRRLLPGGVAERWPVPARTGHKYSRGVLGVVAGSDTYPGAAVLACLGAIRVGVGIVRYVGPRRVTDHVLAAAPEAVPGVGRVQAWLLGSGVEDDAEQDAAIDEALSSGLPCVVDAGALQACVTRRVAGSRPAGADTVLLTPHAGELARMLELIGQDVTREQVESRPAHYARVLAEATDTTVLIKGSTTVIVGPTGFVSSQSDGPAWLATAGSGDVLAGIAGALMATGVDAMDAGAMAAFVHGRAGARASAGGPIAAGDIATATPATVRELLTAQQADEGAGQVARLGRPGRRRWSGRD